MPKYALSFDITLSVTHEVEAENEETAKAMAENVNACEIFEGNGDDRPQWQWDEVNSDSIVVHQIND